MRKMLLLSLFSVVALSGCAPVISGTVRVAEVPGAVVHQPVTANLDVSSTRVTGMAMVMRAQEALGRNQAVRNALAAARADVLVAPTYTIENSGSEIKVTVTGYPATYKDFRNATKADLELLTAAGAEKSTADRSEASGASQMSRTGRLLVLGGTLLLVLVSLAGAGA